MRILGFGSSGRLHESICDFLYEFLRAKRGHKPTDGASSCSDGLCVLHNADPSEMFRLTGIFNFLYFLQLWCPNLVAALRNAKFHDVLSFPERSLFPVSVNSATVEE